MREKAMDTPNHAANLKFKEPKARLLPALPVFLNLNLKFFILLFNLLRMALLPPALHYLPRELQ
jgi:hypothetical protein